MVMQVTNNRRGFISRKNLIRRNYTILYNTLTRKSDDNIMNIVTVDEEKV